MLPQKFFTTKETTMSIKKTKLLITSIALTLALAVAAQAQNPAATPVDVVTAGHAAKTNDTSEYILTEAVEHRNGAVWTNQKISFREDFTITAEIYLGKNDGADGIALVFQDQHNQLVGDGGALGYQGIDPSIAIEFDTYQNEDLADPASDHVAIHVNGVIKEDKEFTEVDDLENGQYHPITLDWDAMQQTLSLSLDNKEILTTEMPQDSVSDSLVHFGFTAATGAFTNEHKVRSITFSKKFDPPLTPPENAAKLDISKPDGEFTFGYSTKDKPSFQKFDNEDSPFPQDPNIRRLNIKGGDVWFSFAQNIGSAASNPEITSKVHYPGKDKGAGVLHPGPNVGDIAMARYTAKTGGVYHFEIEMTLIHEGPTGVGVSVHAGIELVAKQDLTTHLVPSTWSFDRLLETGETVDILVDHGPDGKYSRDHVMITASAWQKGPLPR